MGIANMDHQAPAICRSKAPAHGFFQRRDSGASLALLTIDAVELDCRAQPVLHTARQWSFDVHLLSDPVKASPASSLACQA
jgi:hypothetical protein